MRKRFNRRLRIALKTVDDIGWSKLRWRVKRVEQHFQKRTSSGRAIHDIDQLRNPRIITG